MSIEENIAARKAADAVISLISDEAMEHPGTAFAEHLVKEFRKIVPETIWPRAEQVRDCPMNDEQARQFENLLMEFGKHVGSQIKNVPIEYLCWLDEQPDFRRQLNRYLRSQRGQQAQQELMADAET